MNLGAAVLVFFLAFPARAQSVKAKFFVPGNLPSGSEALTRAYAAVAYLELSGGHCSATLVSSSGHVLTNLHCLLDCLEEKGWTSDGRVRVESGEGWRIWRIREDSRTPDDLVCGGLGLSDGGVRIRGARVLRLGPAFNEFEDVKAGGFPDFVFDKLRGSFGDYALLKFEVSGPTACLPLAQEVPSKGEAVWAIGYPRATWRGDGHDSKGGGHKYISPGKVRSSVRQDPYLRENLEGEEVWRRLERIYSNPAVAMADGDSLPGCSGGPWVDSSGRLAALHFGSVAFSQTRELRANSVGLRAGFIFSEVSAALGADKAREIFSCPAPRPPGLSFF
jgi:hypothetical protein